ncbi:hypothetical protein IWX64_002259 [Arthrobacter sp. CAN_A212]|uniref:hypothetical protein n=1 Tax=Arthrobacter sp. CAN_A212 TaxID=2787719 RepID=UPI0018C94042
MKHQEMTEVADPSLLTPADWEVNYPILPSDFEAPLSRLPEDLSDLPMVDLTALCDAVFNEMNHDFPEFGAQEDYLLLLEELQEREKGCPADWARGIEEGAEQDEQAS